MIIICVIIIARCSDDQLKLTGSTVEYYGRVEICSNQRWGTLSYYHWTPSNAEVACKELGYQCMSKHINAFPYIIAY